MSAGPGKDKVDLTTLMALPKATLASLVATYHETLTALNRASVAASGTKAGKVQFGKLVVKPDRKAGRPPKPLDPRDFSMADSAHAPIPEDPIDPAMLRLFALAVGQQLLGSHCSDRKYVLEALKKFGVPESERVARMLKITRRLSGDRKLLIANSELVDQLTRIAGAYISGEAPKQAE